MSTDTTTAPHSGATARLSDSDSARESEDMASTQATQAAQRVLVIDDDAPARLALVHALAPYYLVTEASSVAAALASLARRETYDAIVCDLRMDAPSAPLHDVLEHHRLPVVLVSGVEAEQLPEVARRHGWRFVAKPCDAPALVDAVRRAMDETRASSDRVTMVPRGSEPVIVQSPTSAAAVNEAVRDGGVPVQRANTPARGSSARATERAQIHDDWSRRLKHVVVSLCITGLTLYGQRTGHPVEWYVVAILGSLGLGTGAVKDAFTTRPRAAVAGVTALVGLAVAGDVLNVSALGAVSSLGVAALPLADRAATALKLTE